MRKLFTTLLVAVVATACGDSTGPDGVTVNVDDDFFSPSVLTVDVGTTVTFEWVGEREHNVTFTGGTVTSPTQASGTWERTFDAAGAFSYTCTIHDSNGEITVE